LYFAAEISASWQHCVPNTEHGVPHAEPKLQDA
jgi:hypothetical protein